MTKGQSSGRSVSGVALPSRDEVLEFINTATQAVGKREIARAFNLRGAAKIELKRLLKDMIDDGVIDKDYRKSLRQPGELPSVVVLDITARDNNGELLAKPANWKEDKDPPSIVIAPNRKPHGPGRVAGVGDRVLARLGPDQEFDYEARVMKILGQGDKRVLGVYQKVGIDGRVTPVDKKARNEFVVPRGDDLNARSGDLVWIDVKAGGRGGLGRGRVVEILGPTDAAGAVSLIAIHQHGIPDVFPDKVLAEAEKAKPVTPKGRTDLRKIPLITIDPADARDHDDAVFAQPDDNTHNEGGWIVYVAIADVAYFVKSGTALDKEALKRGNSSYFPDRVVPMLPESLSAGECSLHEGEDRACLAVRMVFDAHGQKISHEFLRGLMRSAASLTYTQAQNAIDGHPDDQAGPLLEEVIKPLYGAYAAVAEARDKRQPLALDLPERRIELDDNGHVSQVSLRERFDAHKLIEEFMILANVCAAETLEKHRTPCLYRIHDQPSDEKFESLVDFLKSLEFNLTRGQVVRAATFNGILARAKDTAHAHVINEIVLRSQMQACYSPDNVGHFGLNLGKYAHFTSPIRRYSDLLVHRGLIRALKLGDDGLTDEESAQFTEIAQQISDTERRSMRAERESNDRYLAAYMADRGDQEFVGKISGATRFGLFVTLEETGADGLIPIRTLGSDYFIHDEARHALIGERTGQVFQIGGRITVRVVEAAPVTGGLRFELVSVDDSLPPLLAPGKRTRKDQKTRASGKKLAKKATTSRAPKKIKPKHAKKLAKSASAKVKKPKKKKSRSNAKRRAAD